MTDDPGAFFSRLSEISDELRAAFDEHLQDNSGELLPHLLLADYCRLVVSAEPTQLWVGSLLNELEEVFSFEDDDEISSIIAVSFVEHLPVPEEKHELPRLLGQKMKQQYQTIFGSG